MGAYLKTKFSIRFEADVEAKGSTRSSRALFRDRCPSIPEFETLEFLRPDGRIELYAWLSAKDFEELQSPTMDKEFREWLAVYDEYIENREDMQKHAQPTSGETFLNVSGDNDLDAPLHI